MSWTNRRGGFWQAASFGGLRVLSGRALVDAWPKILTKPANFWQICRSDRWTTTHFTTTNLWSGKNLVWSQWSQKMETGIYNLTMKNPIDIMIILKGNSWIFRNTWITVKPWCQDIQPLIWGLPQMIKMKQMRSEIGSKLGQVLESKLFMFPKKITLIWVKFL